MKKLFKIVTKIVKTGNDTQEVKVHICKMGCGYSAMKVDENWKNCPGCSYKEKIDEQILRQGTLRTKSGAPKRKGGNFREVNKED